MVPKTVKNRGALEYIYPTNHTWGSNAVTINLDKWNSLSEDDRAAIEKVATELEPKFWDVSRQGDLDSIAIMTENGMQLVEMSDALKAEISTRAETVQAEFFDRVPDAKAIVDAYRGAAGAN